MAVAYLDFVSNSNLLERILLPVLLLGVRNIIHLQFELSWKKFLKYHIVYMVIFGSLINKARII